jgi:hydrogenase small subunit
MNGDTSNTQLQTIQAGLECSGISRRKFLRFCAGLALATPAGLALTQTASAQAIANRIGNARRPSVIWLEFADCTGCTESLLHCAEPDIAELLFGLISLDYHETLMAGAGRQAEAALQQAVASNRGNYVLVVEGAIPSGATAGYARTANRNALEIVRSVAQDAAFVVAIGSCASWGGVAAAVPNPSGSIAVSEALQNKTIINLPGCPPHPSILLAVLLEHAAMHRLPALDAANRPRFAYDRLIHEDCSRRGHFDAGHFASTFGDEAHRNGWCLYKLGCKGPQTHASCSTRHFNGVINAWPVGIGAPCMGCAEQGVGFHMPLFQLADIHAATPAEALPPIAEAGRRSPIAAAVAIGALAGAGGTAAVFAARRLPGVKAHTEEEEIEELEELSQLEASQADSIATHKERR